MNAPKASIYTTAFCGWCERAKALLERNGISYREIRVDEDPAWRDEMIKRTGQRSVPQIFIGERHVGGFDELHRLEKSGELKQWVDTA